MNWQPIDTAPTDGTEVDVYVAAYDGLPAFETRCAYHPDAGWCADELRAVTHWRTAVADPITDYFNIVDAAENTYDADLAITRLHHPTAHQPDYATVAGHQAAVIRYLRAQDKPS